MLGCDTAGVGHEAKRKEVSHSCLMKSSSAMLLPSVAEEKWMRNSVEHWWVSYRSDAETGL